MKPYQGTEGTRLQNAKTSSVIRGVIYICRRPLTVA